MNFFEILYAQKNGTALPANFFDLLFAKSFTPAIEWDEYDGTLPAQYSANGSMLADYRIYGTAGGVGDRTVNHLSVNKLLQYENSNHYRNASGNIVADNNTNFSELLIPVDENTVYVVKGQLTTTEGYVRIYYLSADFTWISRSDVLQSPTNHPTPSSSFNFTTPANTKYIQIQYGKNTVNTDSEILLTEGSTAPAECIPFGYEVDMSVSDGTTSTTTPIYIGTAPLEEDEYVDYAAGKVYRRTENIFKKNNTSLQLPNCIFLRKTFTNSKATIYKPCFVIFIHVTGGYTYTFSASQNPTSGNVIFSSVFSINKPAIGNTYEINGNSTYMEHGPYSKQFTRTAPEAANWLAVQISTADNLDNDIMIVEGSTAPSTYIPYLQPEDPPVPLPALPTVDGTTITDYAGQSAAPSRFYAKYQRK